MRPTHTPPRIGSVSTAALIVLPVLALAAVGVVSLVMLRGSKTELQTSGDAAALAACRTLADDAFLCKNPDAIQAVLDRARDAAIEYAKANPVEGHTIDLDRNTDHRPDGDIVFGSLDRPLGGRFERLNPRDPDSRRRVNAVRISASRTASGDPLSVRATAFLDFAVIGLRPQYGKPLPLVPVALYSCRSHEGQSPEWSWEQQPRTDAFRYDAATERWVPGEDGIPEVAVVLGRRHPNEHAIHGMPLRIGARSAVAFGSQIREGVAPADLAGSEFGGGLVLNARRQLAVPPASFSEDDSPSEVLDRMARAFRTLASDSAPRIWPMFGTLRDDDERVILTGFVAVRIVKVEEGSGRLRLILQPAIFPTPTAVTEADHPPPTASWGATVCRLRLAE